MPGIRRIPVCVSLNQEIITKLDSMVDQDTSRSRLVESLIKKALAEG